MITSVNMQFEGGVTASLLMNAFNYGGRYIRIFGTKGELYANAKDTEITVFTFENRETTTISVPEVDESIAGGHGGGDGGIVSELYEYLSGSYKGFCAADIDTSVKNHMIGFAAEEARK
ncbi:MAG: gfo/Idh/MocA family oxidoreductase, partial [Clostridia bacterium]|nr:gfo/Idh/MocA family oxidoreductase [Clostridia bacterium]